MYEPSDENGYCTPWKCIEWAWLKRKSRFLKCTKMRSPTRARISGPGIDAPDLRWRQLRS